MIEGSCIGCNQAITQQKREDENIISYAKKKAASENRTIGLYRNEYNQLCICTDGESPIMLITPFMQNA